VTASRAGRATDSTLPRPLTPRYRLDLLVNPLGPSLRVLDAIASNDELHLPHDAEGERLRARLAEMHGVPASWIVLGSGIDDLLFAAVRLAPGPAMLFPPTDSDHTRLAAVAGCEVIEVSRSHRFAIELDPAVFQEHPGVVAIAMSPNDPTGTILTAQDGVRIARKCAFLVVDERHAAYSPRTLIPLAREFDNVVVLRTLETWAGLSGFPIAYAIAPPKLAAALCERKFHRVVSGSAMVAAHATLDDLRHVLVGVERVRDEKARLFRTLRKLNMIRPYPSWANFLLARVERGEADHFAAELHRRCISLHRPAHPLLAGHFRISAVSADATAVLKNALIEIAADL